MNLKLLTLFLILILLVGCNARISTEKIRYDLIENENRLEILKSKVHKYKETLIEKNDEIADFEAGLKECFDLEKECLNLEFDKKVCDEATKYCLNKKLENATKLDCGETYSIEAK